MRNPVHVILLVFACVLPAAATDVARVTEWEVPYPNSRPRDPFVDSAGRVWFCGQAGSYIANLDPVTGSFTKFELADGAGPHNLIIDERDRVWYAANTLPYIGRLDPKPGHLRKYKMPSQRVRDPHTLAFDQSGNIWFTAQWSGHIGRLNMESGKIDLVALPGKGMRPYGIKIDSRGRPWVVLFGSNRLASIDPDSLRLWQVELPNRRSRPRRLEIDAGGNVWYGDYSRGMLGRYDSVSGKIDEWPLPGGENAMPYGMALDGKGNIWLAEAGNPNRLVSFDPKREAFIHVIGVPNARGSIRHMHFDARSNSIWFGEDSNFIGRLQLSR
ncbi:MAG: lyase [Gammaproteobacteria bacterium]|nr:lyase [Gammaproteobacteria bacterium]